MPERHAYRAGGIMYPDPDADLKQAAELDDDQWFAALAADYLPGDQPPF